MAGQTDRTKLATDGVRKVKKIVLALTIPSLLVVVALPLRAAPMAGIHAFDMSKDFAKKGRSKPRVPGGFGCDVPQNIIEHPKCRI
jgi:hypothetical protein